MRPVSLVYSELKKMLGDCQQGSASTLARYLIEDITGLTELNNSYLDFATVDALMLAGSRVASGFPLQYVTGKSHFYGHVFYVDENVLIPRNETEEIVDQILNNHSDGKQRVLDIGTGSGCIAVALKYRRKLWSVFAMDVSDDALDVAKYNAGKMNTEISFFNADIFSENFLINTHRQWDIIVSNPPYIHREEVNKMDKHVKNYEPALALFAPDNNVLAVYQQIFEYASLSLVSRGCLYVELNEFFATQIHALAKNYFSEVFVILDISDKQRGLRTVL